MVLLCLRSSDAKFLNFDYLPCMLECLFSLFFAFYCIWGEAGRSAFEVPRKENQKSFFTDFQFIWNFSLQLCGYKSIHMQKNDSLSGNFYVTVYNRIHYQRNSKLDFISQIFFINFNICWYCIEREVLHPLSGFTI